MGKFTKPESPASLRQARTPKEANRVVHFSSSKCTQCLTGVLHFTLYGYTEILRGQ